jgi:hypothetical protein
MDDEILDFGCQWMANGPCVKQTCACPFSLSLFSSSSDAKGAGPICRLDAVLYFAEMGVSLIKFAEQRFVSARDFADDVGLLRASLQKKMQPQCRKIANIAHDSRRMCKGYCILPLWASAIPVPDQSDAIAILVD